MKWTFRVILLLSGLLVILFLFLPTLGSNQSIYNFATGGIQPASVKAYNNSGTTAFISPSLWISPAVPPALHEQAVGWGIPIVDNPNSASLRVVVQPDGINATTWIYALVTPFPTVTDGVTSQELLANWKGSPTGTFGGHPLLMDPSTLAAFTALWGAPAQELSANRFRRSFAGYGLVKQALVGYRSVRSHWTRVGKSWKWTTNRRSTRIS